MLTTLGDYNAAKLYLAEHEGKIIAGIIVTFFGDTATYYYGASSYEHRQIMAPYLLQWHAILEAKKDGCLIYDFLGISGGGKSAWDKRLSGVTEFKQKFGGEAVHYAKTAEFTFRPFWRFLLG
jgi:lipid II:glycine glycyltransferase (peptidoglycan interpeptide bridge formation enzyme)